MRRHHETACIHTYSATNRFMKTRHQSHACIVTDLEVSDDHISDDDDNDAEFCSSKN